MNLLYTVPTGVPRDVSASSSSRSILVTWETIDCIERNGVITGYIYSVEFQEEVGARTPDQRLSFTASGLTPNTSYTFRVAGVNANGTGPFSNPITVNTAINSEEATSFSPEISTDGEPHRNCCSTSGKE